MFSSVRTIDVKQRIQIPHCIMVSSLDQLFEAILPAAVGKKG